MFQYSKINLYDLRVVVIDKRWSGVIMKHKVLSLHYCCIVRGRYLVISQLVVVLWW